MAKKNTTPSQSILIEPIYQIRNIDLLDYALSSPQTAPTTFQFDIKLEQQHQLKDALSFITAMLIIKSPNDITCGHLSMRCVFSIENLAEIVKHDDSVKALSLKLNQITLSTARGLLFGLFRGTILHQAILPLVDVSALKSMS